MGVGVHRRHRHLVLRGRARQGAGRERVGGLHRLADERRLGLLSRLPPPAAVLGAPAAQGARPGRELPARRAGLRPPGARRVACADGGGVRCAGRPARRPPDPTRPPPGRAARRLRAAPGPLSRQNPRPGGGVAQRLGRDLPSLAPSRTPPDQQRRGAGAAALGDRPQDQSRHPHRHGLAALRPAGQRHRHLSATRPLALALY